VSRRLNGRQKEARRLAAITACRAHGKLESWDCHCTWGTCGCCHLTHQCSTCYAKHTLTRAEAQEVKPHA